MNDEQEVSDVIQDLARKIANVEVANSAQAAKIKKLERENAELLAKVPFEPYEE